MSTNYKKKIIYLTRILSMKTDEIYALIDGDFFNAIYTEDADMYRIN